VSELVTRAHAPRQVGWEQFPVPQLTAAMSVAQAPAAEGGVQALEMDECVVVRGSGEVPFEVCFESSNSL
jgi:hypothetical protein